MDPTFKCSQHAEMAVLSHLPRRLTQGATVVVVRILADGSLANADPCPNCHLHLVKAGVRKIYYSP